ncbi:MAG: hypothetical protein JWM59_2930 [Verrucomicrobiales bacterium]|nr:hypothetical protein [Verrucomicrobiales bacterium]
MASPLLFHVFRNDCTVTGPHPCATLRRELEFGQISLDTQVCLDGTQDWLPLSEWAEKIQPAVQTQRAALAPWSAVYIQATDEPAENTVIRIFWGIIFLLTGFVHVSATFILLEPDLLPACSLSLALAIVWFVYGTRLMSPPKRKV